MPFDPHPTTHIDWAVILSPVAARVGLVAAIRTALEPYPDNPWMDTALLILDERYTDAADALGGIGDVANEAYARLSAAEQHAAAGRRAEASAELDLALAFYRSVGATRYIRQGEALLAASA